MGSSSDKEKNVNLKQKLKTKEEEKKEKEKELKKSKKTSGEEIQLLMEENAKMNEEYKNLSELYPTLENLCKNLEKENYQMRSYCGQMQLMILMKMESTPFKQNVNTFNGFRTQANLYNNQINNLVNSQSSNIIFNNNNINKNNCNINNINNNNCNNKNFNNKNNQDVLTIFFNVDNIKKYPIVCLPENRLGNIFLLLLKQINNEDYSNILKLQFYYNTHNITQHFINNDEIRILKIQNNKVIDIFRTNNCYNCYS